MRWGLLARQGLQIEFSAGVKNCLAREGFSEEFGARELRRLIKRWIEDPITDLILEHSLDTGARMSVKVRRGKPEIEVHCPGREVVRSA